MSSQDFSETTAEEAGMSGVVTPTGGSARGTNGEPKKEKEKGKQKDEASRSKAKGRVKKKKGDAKKPKKSKKRERPHYTARTADKHRLYELSVQCPEADVEFFDRVFRETYGRLPDILREDFCGTSLMCCEWVRTRPTNRAFGIDLDPSVLAWGREHNVAALGDDASRVELIENDVLTFEGRKADVIASFNFSYFIFKDRPTLLAYCRAVRAGLRDQGLFVLDIMGGPDAQVVQEEERELDGFEYVWDQHTFNPVTNEALNYIHFRFPDGSRLKKAFTYDWRLWAAPELRDVLLEAGFREVDVYWEGTDGDGEGNGVFTKSRTGDDSEAWIAYVVATP